jgi:hypothetical protein
MPKKNAKKKIAMAPRPPRPAKKKVEEKGKKKGKKKAMASRKPSTKKA